MAEISLPFAKLSSFSLSSAVNNYGNQIANVKCHFVILEKPLPLFNNRPNRFILTNGKHPSYQYRNSVFSLGSAFFGEGDTQRISSMLDIIF